jgi:hypothetical protein
MLLMRIQIPSYSPIMKYNIKNIYHGTSEKFSNFSFDVAKNVEAFDTYRVIYATDSKEEAKIAGHPVRSKSIVMKLCGELNHPLIVDAKGTRKERSFGVIGYKKLIETAKSKNHDGVIIKNIIDFSDIPQTTYIFFKKESVKLV